MKTKYPDLNRYKIVRYYIDGKKRTMDTNLTLKEAQAHCQDKATRKEGEWFDGYTLDN